MIHVPLQYRLSAGPPGQSRPLVTSRWIGAVFTQINYENNAYIGRPLTASSNDGWRTHSDFPGGGSPQTRQSLPCRIEPITDYIQAGFPWPPVMGVMNTTFNAGPRTTKQPSNIAALYFGTGSGMASNTDAKGHPLNYEAMTNPSSLRNVPVPTGTWNGPPPGALPVIPIIAWNLGGSSLIDVKNGVHDTSTIIPAAQACKRWAADPHGNPAYGSQPGGQVLIRLMHEFNGTWALTCPGHAAQPANCTAASFVGAWQHIVQVFAAQGATNARWVWAPNICNSGAAKTTHTGWATTSGTTAACYPGDAYVDYVALDGYNKRVPNWTTFENLFKASYDWMYHGDAYTNGPVTTTKPMIITEVSSLEAGNFTRPPQTKAQFINDIATVVPATFPNVEGVMLWHDNVGDGLEWYATSSPAAAAAWNNLARSPNFQGKPALIQGITQRHT